MQNVRISRYATPAAGFAGTVSPEDGSWIVFVATDGEALFYRRTEASDLEGGTRSTYVDVELPGLALPDTGRLPTPEQIGFPAHEHPGPLDYEVAPGTDPESGRAGFYARLNARAIMAWGETEHAAIRALLNYVAHLCTAGCLDHTGRPMQSNPRRYRAVFGDTLRPVANDVPPR